MKEKHKQMNKRAALLGAVNVMRRRPGGGWHGDMVDGLGFVGAARRKHVAFAGRNALVVGAGGAGSAIAHALLEAGVSELALHDVDDTRAGALAAKLARYGRVSAVSSADPKGYQVLVNASPSGMSGYGPLPFSLQALAAETFVGCVVTEPAVTPLIAAARAAGCVTVSGTEMYAAMEDVMLDFLIERGVAASDRS